MDLQDDAANFVGTVSEVEEALAAIWYGVLNKKQIGTHHNFFALGRHSLPATQLLARATDAFAVALSLCQFFNNPTIAGMAEFILLESEARERIETAAHPLLSRRFLKKRKLRLYSKKIGKNAK